MTIKNKRYPEFDLARHHTNYDEKLMRTVERQQDELVQARATPEARKLHNMHRQVGCEIHRVEAFTRLNISPKGLLYASIRPEHPVEEFAARFFAGRFPSFIILLESKRGTFVSQGKMLALVRNRLGSVLGCLEDHLPFDDKAKAMMEMQSEESTLWETFYNTQFIKERRNRRYFHRSIPKKLLKTAHLKTEAMAISESRSLKEFS